MKDVTKIVISESKSTQKMFKTWNNAIFFSFPKQPGSWSMKTAFIETCMVVIIGERTCFSAVKFDVLVLDWRYYRNKNPAKKAFNIPRSSSCKKKTSKEIVSIHPRNGIKPKHFPYRSDRSCFISPLSCRKVAASALTLEASVRIPSYKRSRNRLTTLT